MKNKSNNIFENLEIVKEYRWVLWLLILLSIISKNLIQSMIGLTLYKIIITFTMSIVGIYILYQFIQYIKNNDSYDIKNIKKELLICFSVIIFTVIYLIYLLTI